MSEELETRIAQKRIALARGAVEIREQKKALAKADRENIHLQATVAQLVAERDSLAADLEALRGRVAEAMDAENRQNHHLAAIRSVVVEFKAAGEYEFRAETAAEAFLQQKIRALLDDLYEELGMN